MRATDEPIVVEQAFRASVNTVWKAITEADRMCQWFFEAIPEFEARVGFETQFNVRNDDRDFLHLWRVTDVEPPRLLRYNWTYEGYPGDSFVTFELREDDGAASLRRTHRVTESLPEDIPEFTRESGLAGWRYFIQEFLKKYLESS